MLVTELLGTCNIESKPRKFVDYIEIINANRDEIKESINNYYVCESNDRVIGACGISDIKTESEYDIDLQSYREILYLVVDKEYQRNGVGTRLMKLCCMGVEEDIIYEAWGDKETVNSKHLLEKLNFKLLKDLGDTYYKDNNYCSYCVNRDGDCNSCKAEIWIYRKGK